MSLRSRHGYAVDLPHGLRTGNGTPAQEFPADTVAGCAPRPAQIRQVRAGVKSERRNDAGSSRTPLHHADRARTIWQCWHDPALSGLLPPSPAPPGSGCPQLRRPATTGQRRRSLTSTRITAPHGANRCSDRPLVSLGLVGVTGDSTSPSGRDRGAARLLARIGGRVEDV